MGIRKKAKKKGANQMSKRHASILVRQKEIGICGDRHPLEVLFKVGEGRGKRGTSSVNTMRLVETEIGCSEQLRILNKSGRYLYIEDKEGMEVVLKNGDRLEASRGVILGVQRK